MANLYLARHGETFFNLEKRMGGNSSLTPEGFKQAEAHAKLLKKHDFAAIYCSTLLRSMQTAVVIHRTRPKTPLIVRQDLVEMRCGDLESMTYAQFKKDFPDLYAARYQDKYGWTFPGGENYELLRQRVTPIVDSWVGKGEQILVVGHQSLNRSILGYLATIPKDIIPNIETRNDVVFEVDLVTREIVRFNASMRERGYALIAAHH